MAYLREEFENLEQEYRKKNTFWRRWAAVFILLAFFLASWGGQFVTQLDAQKQEAQQHGEEFTMSEFWPEFWSATFENWQSEWLQLTAQALIVAGFAEYLFRKGDEQHYKTHLMLDELRSEIKKSKR